MQNTHPQAGSRAKTPRRGGATAVAAGLAEFPTRERRRAPKSPTQGLPRAPTCPTRALLRVPELLTPAPPRVPQFPTRARRWVPQFLTRGLLRAPEFLTRVHHPLAAAEFLPQEPFLPRRRRPRRTRRRHRRRSAWGAEARPAAEKVCTSLRSRASVKDAMLGEQLRSSFSLRAISNKSSRI